MKHNFDCNGRFISLMYLVGQSLCDSDKVFLVKLSQRYRRVDNLQVNVIANYKLQLLVSKN